MARFMSLKRFLPRTLLGRSLLILIIPVFLIQVFATYMFFDRHWNRMMTRLAFAISGEVAVVTSALRNPAERGQAVRVLQNVQNNLEIFVRFRPLSRLPAQNRPLEDVHFWEISMADRLRAELSAQIPEPFLIETNAEGDKITVLVQMVDGVLSVSFPARRLFSSSGYVFLFWMFSASFLLLGVAIVFMRNQIRPIRKLAVAAERFGKGRDTPSFKPEGAIEVRQAALAFLEMRRRIQRQISQRTEMLAGVSHDLRTPLTRLRLQLALLPDTPDTQGMKQDVLDMERMIGGYLDFVRGDGEEQFASVVLHDLLEKSAENLRRQGTPVSIDIPPGLRLMVRPLAFERAMNNILVNAGQYGTQVWGSVEAGPDKLVIRIEDNGPGLAPEFYEAVFKPFVRVDSARNADTGGVGLGLAIALDIIHAHGGNITLGPSTAHGGLMVTILLPV